MEDSILRFDVKRHSSLIEFKELCFQLKYLKYPGQIEHKLLYFRQVLLTADGPLR